MARTNYELASKMAEKANLIEKKTMEYVKEYSGGLFTLDGIANMSDKDLKMARDTMVLFKELESVLDLSTKLLLKQSETLDDLEVQNNKILKLLEAIDTKTKKQ